MLRASVLAIYLGGWVVYTLSLFAINQIWNLTFGLVSLVFSLRYLVADEKFTKLLPLKIFFIFSSAFVCAAFFSFLMGGGFPSLGKMLMFFSLFTFYFLLLGITPKDVCYFQRISLFCFFGANFIALFVLSQFNLVHFKFIPAVSWAFATSNNISFYVTLLAGLIVAVDCFRFGRPRLSLSVILLVFVLIHFSKAHFAAVLIGLALAYCFRFSLLSRIAVFLILFLLVFFVFGFGVSGLESWVLGLDVKPLTKIFYGLMEFPILVRSYGVVDALFLFVEDVGDSTRASIYRSAIENFGNIGLFGAPQYLVSDVFRGRDYHNTIFYISYEFGVLGLLGFIGMLCSAGKAIFGSAGSLRFFSIALFVYFLIRMLFISIDVYWLAIYWAVFIKILNIGKYKNG